jgi:hypothetical protein
MLYCIILQDAEGSEAARQQHHDGHIQHFKAHRKQLALSGPLKQDDGSAVGSLVVIDCDSQEAARTFIEGDPFYSAGVWKDVFIAQFKASIVDAGKLS